MSKTFLEPRPLRKLINSTIDSFVEALTKLCDNDSFEAHQKIKLVASYDWDDKDGLKFGVDAKGVVGSVPVGADLEYQEKVERLGEGQLLYELEITVRNGKEA